MENFLSSKAAEVYLKGINKLQDKEVTQNRGNYTIAWNQFIVKLFMNKLYFTETEIIYDSTQYIYIYIYIYTHTPVYIYVGISH